MGGVLRPAGDIRYKVRQISAAAAAGMIEGEGRRTYIEEMISVKSVHLC